MALPVAPSVPPPPDPAWTEAERWAWNKIVEGSIADFQDRPGCAGCPDPSAGSTGWTDPCRQISPRFLEAALTQSPWRDAIPRQGFRVAGARVEGRIDLSNAHIDAEVQLERMRFEQCLVITSAHFASSLSINGSTFEDGISGDFLRVDGSRFTCCNATARGERFDLLRATIDGNLNLSGSKFECNEVRLVRLSLAGDLLAKNCNLAVCLDLFGASIEGSVNLEGSTLPALRLAAASISDELVLTRCPERPVKWTTSAVAAPAAQPVLDLRSARIGALADLPLPKMPKPTQKNADSRVTQAGWPSSLDVQGLHYDRLGGAADPDGVSMAARDSAWYVAWLSRNASSGSQPYQKLAANLRASGHVRQANDVLFAARDRELSEAWRSKSLRRWLFLFFARLLIGTVLVPVTGRPLFLLLHSLFLVPVFSSCLLIPTPATSSGASPQVWITFCRSSRSIRNLVPTSTIPNADALPIASTCISGSTPLLGTFWASFSQPALLASPKRADPPRPRPPDFPGRHSSLRIGYYSCSSSPPYRSPPASSRGRTPKLFVRHRRATPTLLRPSLRTSTKLSEAAKRPLCPKL